MEETESKIEGESEEESSPSTEVDGVKVGPQVPPETESAPPPSTPQPRAHFPGELPISFQEALAQTSKRNRLSFLLFVFFNQPILGALPHKVKMDLEARIDRPACFSASGATGLNILLNLIAYPVVLVLLAALVSGVDVLFSQKVNGYILVGLLLGLVEGFYRLREGVLQVKPEEELVFRASFYGAPLAGLLSGFLARHSGLLRRIPIPVEGFYGKGFVDKRERERRYGQVYTIEDLGEAYHLRMEFPRKIPDIELLGSSTLQGEMPDYDYELVLKDGHFIVKGRCVDEMVKKITGNAGAFPSGFTTVIPLQEKVHGFSHHYGDKFLEVLLVKEKSGGESPG